MSVCPTVSILVCLPFSQKRCFKKKKFKALSLNHENQTFWNSIHVPIDRFHYLLPPRRYVKAETKTHQIKIARPYMCFAYLFNYLFNYLSFFSMVFC